MHNLPAIGAAPCTGEDPAYWFLQLLSPGKVTGAAPCWPSARCPGCHHAVWVPSSAPVLPESLGRCPPPSTGTQASASTAGRKQGDRLKWLRTGLNQADWGHPREDSKPRPRGKLGEGLLQRRWSRRDIACGVESNRLTIPSPRASSHHLQQDSRNSTARSGPSKQQPLPGWEAALHWPVFQPREPCPAPGQECAPPLGRSIQPSLSCPT